MEEAEEVSEDLSRVERAEDRWTLSDFVREAHDNSRAHGFWDVEDPRDPIFLLSRLALVASEVGEAVEDIRDADHKHLGEELADIVIRVMDMAGGLKIDLEGHVLSKMSKNRRRPHGHGRRTGT